MANQVTKKIKLQIPAGKATPAPPVGTVLGPAGINLQEFCTKYNDATKDKMGDVLPVEISIYEDRSFDFVIKTPPAAFLLKKVAKIKSGSGKGSKEIVATITKEQLREIAEIKLPDLNAYTVEEAMKIETKKLHDDWDRTNQKIHLEYPEIILPPEIDELGVVKFVDDGKPLTYVDWEVINKSIKFLRLFDPILNDLKILDFWFMHRNDR